MCVCVCVCVRAFREEDTNARRLHRFHLGHVQETEAQLGREEYTVYLNLISRTDVRSFAIY